MGSWGPIGWTQDLRTTRTPRRDLLELSVAYGLILLVIWTPRPWQVLLWVLAAASILAITCMSFEGLEAMGLCSANFLCSLWAVGLSAAIAAAAVLLAERFHTLHAPGTPYLFVRHYGVYAVWAWVQQVLLQCFCLSRLMRLLRYAPSAAAIAAVMFAVVHLPSPVLTVVTLTCGMAACLLFLRYRNLYTIALAHAILGTSVAICVPAPIIHNMRIGRSYLTYVPRPAPLAQRSIAPLVRQSIDPLAQQSTPSPISPQP